MTKSLEQSVKEKIRKVAASESRQFNEVWKQVVLERLLARLSESPYKDKFIFKGGMCLARYLKIGRETQDLDFLVKGISTNRETLEQAFNEISQIDVGDGFTFNSIRLNPLTHTHMQYPGFEIAMTANLGLTRTHIRIDLGVGDVVTPEHLTVSLLEAQTQPEFKKEIDLLAYSPEQIFAEKYQTAVSRGAQNSRMKDYHDLVLLIQSDVLERSKTKGCIDTTFKHRKTPRGLIPEFNASEQDQLSKLWRAHLRLIKSDGPTGQPLPKAFHEVHALVNHWVAGL